MNEQQGPTGGKHVVKGFDRKQGLTEELSGVRVGSNKGVLFVLKDNEVSAKLLRRERVSVG